MYDKNAEWYRMNWWFVKLHVSYLVNFQIISLYIKNKITVLVITYCNNNSGKYISNIWAITVKFGLKVFNAWNVSMAMAMPVNWFYQIQASK